MSKVALEIKFKRIPAQPPMGKRKHYPALELTVIEASERGTPMRRSSPLMVRMSDARLMSVFRGAVRPGEGGPIQ